MSSEEAAIVSDIIESTVDLRPTLVIGLGGSGHQVLVRLKAHFLGTFGEEVFRIIKLLAFDTADESFTALTEDGKQVKLDRQTELVNIGNVPVSRILQNLDRHPTISSWLPENLAVSAIVAGAKQIRPLGRLAFFYHYNQDAKIHDRLQAVLGALTNIKLKGKVGEGAQVAKTRGVNIFVVCSLCGGTGSGIFLDMAYLVRQLLAERGIVEGACHVNGVLILPAAFAMVASDAIMANAYAAIRELNYFTEGKFKTEYPGGQEIDIHMRPFNICYLVDAVNAQGKSLTGMEDLAPMIAEAIFLQIGSQVGQAMGSVFDNVKSLSQQDNGEPMAFSSLGTASLVFPARRIISSCALRFGRQLIHDGILKVPSDEADGLAREFAERAQLLPQPLLQSLCRDPRGQPIQIKLVATELAKSKTEDVIRDTESFLQMFEVRRLNGDYKKLTDQNVEALQAKAKEMLRAEVVRLTDNPAYGPRLALNFLDSFNKGLRGLMEGFDRERRTIGEQVNRQKQALPALREALKNAVGGLALGKGRRIAKARDEYIEAKEKELAGQFEIRKRSLAIQLLSFLGTAAAELHQQLATLIDKLSVLEERFAREGKELALDAGERRFVLTTDATTPADVERYYNTFAREVAREHTRFADKVGSLFQLGLKPEQEIRTAVLGFASELFQPISRESLEDIIRQKREQIPPAQRLEALREDSVPFWNINTVKMSKAGDMDSIEVIGVCDMNSTIYKDEIRKGDTLISTQDPYRMTVLHTKHGLPYFALVSIDYWQRKYDEHKRRQVSPLHLFPNLPWLEGEEVARQWFALGQAFGYIEKSGPWYYCQPRDEIERNAGQKIKLAQGLDASVAQFVRDQHLVEDISAMIEERIGRIGNEAAAGVLQAYIDLPLSKDAEVAKLEMVLKKLVVKFKSQMESG